MHDWLLFLECRRPEKRSSGSAVVGNRRGLAQSFTSLAALCYGWLLPATSRACDLLSAVALQCMLRGKPSGFEWVHSVMLIEHCVSQNSMWRKSRGRQLASGVHVVTTKPDDLAFLSPAVRASLFSCAIVPYTSSPFLHAKRSRVNPPSAVRRVNVSALLQVCRHDDARRPLHVSSVLLSFSRQSLQAWIQSCNTPGRVSRVERAVLRASARTTQKQLMHAAMWLMLTAAPS